MSTSAHASFDIRLSVGDRRVVRTLFLRPRTLKSRRMASLARLILRHRLLVVFVWLALTLFGGFSAGQVSKRWFQSFSIPGYSAYEADQRMLKTFGSGENAPLLAVGQRAERRRHEGGRRQGDARGRGEGEPRARASSYFSTGNAMYVSHDRRTTFEEIFRPGTPGFYSTAGHDADAARDEGGRGAGTTFHVTGPRPDRERHERWQQGPSVLGEALIGGLGAVVILFFVFGTLPAVAMPLLTAVAAILNTFTLVWILTYVTDVSIIVQFLIALVGLGVSIDYALLMIFRFREELRHGNTVEDAVVTTMRHAGRSATTAAAIAAPIPPHTSG